MFCRSGRVDFLSLGTVKGVKQALLLPIVDGPYEFISVIGDGFRYNIYAPKNVCDCFKDRSSKDLIFFNPTESTDSIESVDSVDSIGFLRAMCLLASCSNKNVSAVFLNDQRLATLKRTWPRRG